jgi:GNAT superfamily N-acetyltransferase
MPFRADNRRVVILTQLTRGPIEAHAAKRPDPPIAGGGPGWCDVIPKQRQVYSHCGVLGMGLLPPFRGKGYGAALLDATLNKARRQGLARIELAVRADNAQAIRLYKKVGFRQEGILKGGMRVDESYNDVIMMAIVDPAVALAGGGSGLPGAWAYIRSGCVCTQGPCAKPRDHAPDEPSR